MMRNVGFCVATVLCLLVGFAGALMLSEQVALADACNNLERDEQPCNTGSEKPCANWGGMGQGPCEAAYGWYTQKNYWATSGLMNFHTKLSSQYETCAEIYKCKWNMMACVQGAKQLPDEKQIYAEKVVCP